MTKIFLFSSLLLLFSQCKLGYDGGRYMDFYNNSGKPICYSMLWEFGILYPDTILPEKNPNPYKFDKERHFSLAYNENDLFAKFPTDTMSIFFFDPDTLAKYEWETIREEYKILVRYDLSHNDLRKLNWRIYYPPTEAMKDMKMYPPFGQ
jgi:hypothetical protein